MSDTPEITTSVIEIVQITFLTNVHIMMYNLWLKVWVTFLTLYVCTNKISITNVKLHFGYICIIHINNIRALLPDAEV